jgi:hypothetical protein
LVKIKKEKEATMEGTPEQTKCYPTPRLVSLKTPLSPLHSPTHSLPPSPHTTVVVCRAKITPFLRAY